MGEAIVSAIESGLGLIGSLGQNFLNGFSALFWDATATTPGLTSFGTFALVMFGIGIAVGCIKLVFNLITHRAM